MQLGEKQLLKVVKKVEFGVYLGEEDSEERVLLPIKQVPENIEMAWKYFYIRIPKTV